MSFTTGIGGHNDPNCSTLQCICKNISTLSISVWTAAQFGDERTIRRKGEQKRSLLSQLDQYGYSPLHYAAQNGHETIVQYLLSEKVPIDLEGCGATPLHRAVFGGSFICVKLLVEAGANINAIDRSYGDGNTPAHKALLVNRKDILTYLMNQGADINIVNAKGQSVQLLIENPKLLACDEEEREILSGDNSILCQPSRNHTDMPSTPFPVSQLPRCSKCNKESLSFAKTRKGSLICNICRELG